MEIGILNSLFVKDLILENLSTDAIEMHQL